MAGVRSPRGASEFPAAVKRRALVACRRHCCLCQKYCGTKIECHHIVARLEGGANSFDNCIPLCFDCHADVKSYNNKHPRGTKFTHAELRKRRDLWYAHDKSRMVPVRREADKKTLLDLMDSHPGNGTIKFLRDFDFGNPFERSRLDGIYRLIDKRNGPEHEFIDSHLEELRRRLLEACTQFANCAGTYTFPHGTQIELNEVPSEWAVDQPQKWDSVVTKLNSLTTEICKHYDEIVRVGRRKLED